MMNITVLGDQEVKINVDEITERQALIEAVTGIAGMIRFFAENDEKLAISFVKATKEFLNDVEAIRLIIGDEGGWQ